MEDIEHLQNMIDIDQSIEFNSKDNSVGRVPH